jgi:hypothetical protein
MLVLEGIIEEFLLAFLSDSVVIYNVLLVFNGSEVVEGRRWRC